MFAPNVRKMSDTDAKKQIAEQVVKVVAKGVTSIRQAHLSDYY